MAPHSLRAVRRSSPLPALFLPDQSLLDLRNTRANDADRFLPPGARRSGVGGARRTERLVSVKEFLSSVVSFFFFYWVELTLVACAAGASLSIGEPLLGPFSSTKAKPGIKRRERLIDSRFCAPPGSCIRVLQGVLPLYLTMDRCGPCEAFGPIQRCE